MNLLEKITNKVDKLLNSRFVSYNVPNREKWIERKLNEIESGLRVLDAGAGELQYKKFCNHLNYISQDFCQYTGIGDSKGLQMSEWNTSKIDIISDITNIPEADASFDAIMCFEVFEHIPEPIKAVKEFGRLLKKNGILLITAPFCSLTHFAPYHFYSGFNRYFYEKIFPDNGFEIQEIESNGNYFDYIIQEVNGRIPNAYTTIKKTFFDVLVKHFFLKSLKKMSKLEKKSSEIMCFGYHVKAIKK